MKQVATLKSTKIESPKTPGGISKSLLTPCRRVGLSRKWKNPGISPFVSPITHENELKPEPIIVKAERKKRKTLISEENSDDDDKTENVIPKDCLADIAESDIASMCTPSRSVLGPQRKKSKSIPIVVEPNNLNKTESDDKTTNSIEFNMIVSKPTEGDIVNIISHEKQALSPDNNLKENNSVHVNELNTKEKSICKPGRKKSKLGKPKAESPNNLAKECIVVIQRKLFKSKDKISVENPKTDHKINSSVSQTLFDSDSDNEPLVNVLKGCKPNMACNLENLDNPKQVIDTPIIMTNNDEDDDFCKKTTNLKVKKLQHKTTSTTDAKVNKMQDRNTSTGDLNKSNKKAKKFKAPDTVQQIIDIDKPSSQSSNSFDEDDDDDFDCKKTVIIRKTYDKKIVKPSRAKSTGSITQKDIDEVKARIEMKKNQLLAKTMTNDTVELRGLITKWKKGCQDALTELMELMKLKFPEKGYMDYSEILQMLKIPPNLVGYDSDNDCFISPDDASTILSQFI